MRQPGYFLTITFVLAWCSLRAQVTLPKEFDAPGKITIVVFLALDCPISQKYMGTLNEIMKENEGQIVLYGIIPGKVDKADIRKFRKEYQASFGLIRDPGYRWTGWFQAGFTPEVFMFNQNREFIYQGAVDNWFYDLGNYRQRITENYLRDMIAEILEGKKPLFKKTETVGCIIQKPVKQK